MREIIIGIAALSGLGTAGYMTGTFGSGEYYEIAPADVSEKLSHMTMPEGMEDATGTISLRTVAAGQGQVRWHILANGYSFAQFDAFLKPSGSGTRVTVDFAMIDGPEKEQLAKVVPVDDEFLGDMVKMALTEQIDATLESRPFDQRRIAAMMTGYVAANPGKVAKFQQSVQGNLNNQLHESEDGGGYFNDGGSFDDPPEDNSATDDWSS